MNHLELLNFLSEPHYLNEVARYFGISGMRAKYHIKEAIKSGHVLTSEQFAFGTFSDSRGKLKQKERFLYVSRNSPLLSKDPLQLAVSRDKGLALASTINSVVAKFASASKIEKKPTVESKAKFGNEKVDTIRSVATHSESKANLLSTFLNVDVVHGKSIERRKHTLPGRQGKPPQNSHGLISQVDRIHLLDALLEQPLTFSELHKHFGVSRQTVRSFVRKRLLAEVWGPKEVGVRFKLTRTGEKYLEKLHAAASFDPQKSKGFSFV